MHKISDTDRNEIKEINKNDLKIKIKQTKHQYKTEQKIL